MNTIILIVAIAFVLSWIPALVAYFFARRRDSGDRVITCPETGTTEVVRVDAGHAAWTDLRGERELRLEACTRWPEKKDCGQDCLTQIECAPDGCLGRERLEAWYRGSECALCGMEIGPIRWFEHRPGLLTPEHRALWWEEIRAKDLPAALAVDRPICSPTAFSPSRSGRSSPIACSTIPGTRWIERRSVSTVRWREGSRATHRSGTGPRQSPVCACRSLS